MNPVSAGSGTLVLFRVPVDGGGVVTLATSPSGSPAIAIGDGTVFWGGAPNAPSSPWSGASSIAADATDVYWAYGAYVLKAPHGGGTPMTLVAQSDDAQTSGVAVDGTSVYWTRSDGTVMKVPLDGGTRTTLASGQDSPGGIAVDATSVYWTTLRGGTVARVPLDGGTPVTLAAGRDYPAEVVVDSQSLYWDDFGTDTANNPQAVLMKLPLSGGPATTMVSGPEPSATWRIPATGIAVDATSVYWTTQDSVLKLTPK